MATTKKALSLKQYKASAKINTLEAFTSRKSGKKYFCDEEGNYIGMIAENFDPAKPVVVFFMEDTDADTGVVEEWLFFANGEERKAEFTL